MGSILPNVRLYWPQCLTCYAGHRDDDAAKHMKHQWWTSPMSSQTEHLACPSLDRSSGSIRNWPNPCTGLPPTIYRCHCGARRMCACVVLHAFVVGVLPDAVWCGSSYRDKSRVRCRSQGCCAEVVRQFSHCHTQTRPTKRVEKNSARANSVVPGVEPPNVGQGALQRGQPVVDQWHF